MHNIPGNAPQYDMSTVSALAGTPLDGKQVLFLGSSVTYGSGSEQQSIPEYFAARFGCRCIKEAVSGTTLVDNGPDSYVSRLRNRIDPAIPVDLMICQLSTNDASLGLPLGEISGSTAPDRYDTATITGAMEAIIRYATGIWGCRIAIYTGSRYGSAAYEQMVLRAKELGEKWGILVLDLWSSDDFNSITDVQRALYMRDPIHPTKAGYRNWWCPELERQLLEHLSK